MPIRKFDRIVDENGLKTLMHDCIVECDECGKQINFQTYNGFGDTYEPPEVEGHGLTKILKPQGYDFICKDHVK